VIRTTRHYLDTCDCIIEHQWDDTEDELTRTISLSSVVQKCAFHAGTSTQQVHYTVVMEEQVRKNDFIQTLVDEIAALNSPDELVWVFDGQRKLVITLPTHLSQADKTTAINLAEADYPGLILIEGPDV
jgi:hypothetical protein